MIRSRQQTLNVYGAFDALESTSPSRRRALRTHASYDSLRVLRLGADYALSDIWLGAERSAVNALSVRVSEGMKILGATTNGIAGHHRGRASRPASSSSTSRPAARRRCSLRGTAPASA